jgi:hypothetical protein
MRRDRTLAALRDLRIGEIAVSSLELLEAVLIALRSGIEPEATSRRKTIRGVVVLSTALGEASAIAASTVARTGGVIFVEITTTALTLLAEGARRSGASASGTRIPSQRPPSHGGEMITSRRRGNTLLAAPVKP